MGALYHSKVTNKTIKQLDLLQKKEYQFCDDINQSSLQITYYDIKTWFS